MTQISERQDQSLTQAQIDPLRQGQRLNAIDQKPKHDSSKTEVTLDAVMQKPKHDSSKTEVTLDAVMQEAEGKRGNQEPQTKQKLP